MMRNYNPISNPELNQAISISDDLCNITINLITKIKPPSNNHADMVLVSMLNITKKTKAILLLIFKGYENEAFILWRSLHE